MYIKQFHDLQHAKSYLQHSIIRYRKNPVYVANIGPGKEDKDFLLTYHELKDVRDGLRPKLGNFPDNVFDFTPVPLGMLNLGHGSVLYISRMPIRQWKIGLTTHNSTATNVLVGDEIMDYPRWLYTSKMRDMIRGKYPKLKEVLDGPGAAFSRRFAIRDRTLYYQTRGAVGGLDGRQQPILNDKFFFLKEALMEDLNG